MTMLQQRVDLVSRGYGRCLLENVRKNEMAHADRGGKSDEQIWIRNHQKIGIETVTLNTSGRLSRSTSARVHTVFCDVLLRKTYCFACFLVRNFFGKEPKEVIVVCN